ncbi:MAG: hypothetical protein ACE5GI_04260 [Candidatus Aminicenantales bacterium]
MDREIEKGEFRIRIGDPESDSDFLIYGFGCSTAFEEWPCHWTSAKAALKLPILPGSISSLSLISHSLLRQHDKQGKFITIPAFEWTSDFYGHKNVYYAKEDQPYFPSSHPRSDSPPTSGREQKRPGNKPSSSPLFDHYYR